jgi:hypothetical protein
MDDAVSRIFCTSVTKLTLDVWILTINPSFGNAPSVYENNCADTRSLGDTFQIETVGRRFSWDKIVLGVFRCRIANQRAFKKLSVVDKFVDMNVSKLYHAANTIY